jgi:hypothetical protein
MGGRVQDNNFYLVIILHSGFKSYLGGHWIFFMTVNYKCIQIRAFPLLEMLENNHKTTSVSV